MKPKSLYLAIFIAGVLSTAAFFIYPVPRGEAQKSTRQEFPGGEDVMAKLRDNPRAAVFYDKLSISEPDLVLARFSPPSTIEKQSAILMVFLKGGEEYSVNISEYESAEDAKSPMNIAINADTRKYKDYGDEGMTVYSTQGKGGFSGLMFRKDRFYVSVYGKDEATAKRLAGYAFETITR